MPLRIGCDLVVIKDFEARLFMGGAPLLESLFWPAEYLDRSLETLAGIFAAKEAIIAVRDNADTIRMEDFGAAIDRVMAGPEKKSLTLPETENNGSPAMNRGMRW
jgi:hypothetical protein